MVDLVGQTLDRYRIVERIGAGGMGEVYRAYDPRLDRDVAVKVVAGEVAARAGQLERFEREARAAAALEHPNILAVHELGVHDGRPFIVTELLEGQTVRSAIDRRELTNRQVIEIGIQVTRGLAAAHDRGIIHRDIKPSNLFLTEDGTVKILDFGLAKLAAGVDESTDAAEAETEELLTAVGSTVGTVGYTSPEQVRGVAVDHRSDLFSLGVVLYEMLTGLSPFRRPTPADTATAVLTEDPPPVSDTTSRVTPAFDGVVRRCLHKDPADRFQSARDLGLALQTLVEGVPRPRPDRDPPRPTLRILAIVPAVLVAVFAFVLLHMGYRALLDSRGPPEVSDELPRIVVLPFDNLGPSDDAYFADGVTEEITTRLASLSGLQVISRTTAKRCAASGASAAEIGAELDVEYLLEGTVRWAHPSDGPGRVRITPQLIRTADDSHLWAERYDREVDDVFAVQSEIASQVAAKLGVSVLESEREVLTERPTDSIEAYHAYIRGRWLASRPHFTIALWPKMLESFRHAVELDPGFALAHAQLARSHAELRYYAHDFSRERLELARAAARRATSLGPRDPRVHLALAHFHLLSARDTERAEREIELARRSLGSANPELLEAEIFAHELRGDLHAALALADEAMRLDPLNPSFPAEAIFDSWGAREYPRAIEYADTAFELAPDSFWPNLGKAVVYWSWTGDLESARRALEGVAADASPWIEWAWFWQELFEGRFEDALERFDDGGDGWLRTKFAHRPRAFMRATALELTDRPDAAALEWRRAREMVESALATSPDDYLLHASHGIVLAALGEREPALAAGRTAMELLPVSRDARYGLVCEVDMARIHTMLGELEPALDQLDRLLTIPSWVSVAWIEINPIWDPLRGRPGYTEMLDGHRADRSVLTEASARGDEPPVGRDPES